jgi:hypothetical protein
VVQQRAHQFDLAPVAARKLAHRASQSATMPALAAAAAMRSLATARGRPCGSA